MITPTLPLLVLTLICSTVSEVNAVGTIQNHPICKAMKDYDGIFATPCFGPCTGGYCSILVNKPGNRAKVETKPCKCDNELCTHHLEFPNGTLISSPLDCGAWGPIDCAYTRRPPAWKEGSVTLVVFTKLSGLPQFEVKDQNGALLLSDRVDYRSSFPATWSLEEEITISSQSKGVRYCDSRFEAKLYYDFCSGSNGVLSFPTARTQFHPYLPLMSTNYNRLSTGFRKDALCRWEFGDSVFGKHNDLFTIYFTRFDIRNGAKIDITYEKPAYGLTTVRFNETHPPYPIYTNHIAALVFKGDAHAEGTGFDADITTNSCPPFIAVNASSGRITDGTPGFLQYNNNLHCSWLLTFSEDEPVETEIIFEYFVLRRTDTLSFYDGTASGRPILIMSGDNPSNKSYKGYHRSIFVSFQTSNDHTTLSPSLKGFAFSWKACSENCQKCPSGSSYNFNTNTCEPCPPFTVSQTGNLTCWRCPPGYLWASPSECIPCPAGTTSDGRYCHPCPNGTISLHPASPSCTPCPQGFTSSLNNCIPCPPDHITDHFGNCVNAPGRYNVIILIYVACCVITLLALGGLVALQHRKLNPESGYQYDSLSYS